MNQQLEKEYLEHEVFKKLEEYTDFYSSLSFSIMNWHSQGTNAIINIDTYMYSSIQGTIESIKEILSNGRINDSYALLRKFYDSTIINVYSNSYLNDHVNIDGFIVAKIDNWIKGTEKIPEYRVMSQYIKDSPTLGPITSLLQRDRSFKEIRDRCNDHTHYNYFRNLLSNDKDVYMPNRVALLNTFAKDLDDIFIQHFSYIFYLNDHYMMSSDYIDSLELGLTPEENSQYFVAPFIQDIFDKVIKTKRPDLANEIKSKTSMALE